MTHTLITVECKIFIFIAKLIRFFLFFPLIFTGNWEDNWVYSKAEGKEFGKFELTAGKFYNDAENDKGMHRYFNSIIRENRVNLCESLAVQLNLGVKSIRGHVA